MDKKYHTKIREFLVLIMVATGALVSASAETYPAPEYKGPASHPDTSWMSPFNPSVTNTAPNADTPEIAEWTRINQPGDTMALTGEKFSLYSATGATGQDTAFVFYGEGLAQAVQGRIQLLDGRQCALTIPDELLENDMYLLWPRNKSGYGKPVEINQTEAWWVGPDQVTRGDVFSIFGRSLSLGSGVSHLYIDGYGWISNSISANPYKADFRVPSDLKNGTYTVYAHNGHGGEYGWASGQTLVINNGLNWEGGNTINVKDAPYNAKGDGLTDDFNAISSALKAAGSGDTIYFPAGTYLVSQPLRDFNSDHRIKGDGIDSTVIKTHPSFSGRPYLVLDTLTNAQFEDMSFESGAMTLDSMFWMRHSSNVKFIRVGFSQLEDPLKKESKKNPIEMQFSIRIFFKDCRFIVRHSVYAYNTSQVFIDGCNFFGINDANSLFNHTCNGLSVVNSTAQPYDISSSATGEGWCKGRWLTSRGHPGFYTRNWYIGNNTTTDMCPRDDSSVDRNSGEQILAEGLRTKYRGTPTSATSTTVTFGDLTQDLTVGDLTQDLTGSVVAVVDGAGLAQHRVVTSINANTKTITIDQPWKVLPDTNSVLMIGTYCFNVAVYNNYFDGQEFGVTYPRDVGSDGINAYGGFFNLIVDSNTFHQVRSAIEVWSLIKDLPGGFSTGLAEPNYFNLFVNNRIDRCRYAMENRVANFNELSYIEDIGLLGNVFRKNMVSNMESTPITMTTWETFPSIYLPIFQGNTFSNIPAGINNFDKGYWYTDESPVMNQVYIDNEFNDVTGGKGIYLSNGATANFHSNKWDGAAYSGDLPGAQLELHKRVKRIYADSPNDQFEVYNSGTAPLNWQAVADSSWVNVAQSTGDTVTNETDTGVLDVTIDTASAPTTNTEAVITVSSKDGLQIQQVVIEYYSPVEQAYGVGVTYPDISSLFDPGARVRAKLVDLGTADSPLLPPVPMDLGEVDIFEEFTVSGVNLQAGHEYWIEFEVYDAAVATWEYKTKIRFY